MKERKIPEYVKTAPPVRDLVPAEFKPQEILSPKTNWIIAISLFVTSLIVYLLTNAKTMSFWD
ncbi:MAG TPA: hypothetical protein PKK33_00980, partial [Candidatus Cloacimonadota bacterium]|nr:hypothetical protein [Candidatus Cloacimonadota bacterium]